MDEEYFDQDEQVDEKAVEEELKDALLQSAYSEIAQLKRTNKALIEQQLELRDNVALHCFVSIYEKSGDARQSAADAYRMADAFLRVKETGGIVDDKPHNNE